MKTYTMCRERAEEEAAAKTQVEATTQAHWEQIHEVTEETLSQV